MLVLVAEPTQLTSSLQAQGRACQDLDSHTQLDPSLLGFLDVFQGSPLTQACHC